jgi:predicted membrane protein
MSSSERPGLVMTPQAVFGICIVTVGLLLMAGNFGWIEARSLLYYWPIGIAAIGATMYARAMDGAARTIAGTVMVIGVWMTGARVFGYDADLGDIWPIIMIVAGAAMVSRARGRNLSSLAASDQHSDFAFWSGIERRIQSSAFKRGEFTVVMGGIEVDLREASTAGEAVIDVFVVWGGLEIRVPPDWSVSNQVVAIMGAAVDKSTGTRDAKNRLILRGFVLMGGIEVKV